jgi:cytochrome c556
MLAAVSADVTDWMESSGGSMKTMYVVAGLTALLVAGIVFAQSDSDYQGWMKSNGAAMASLQKNIAAKDGNGIAADAHTIEGNLKQAEAFWTKRGGAPDAVNFAKMGQMAAATLAKDAAGNMDAVAGDLKSLQGNCGGCHMAHREKTEAGFKFK